MSGISDRDWLALRAGDHAALGRLYKEHAPGLLRYGRKLADQSRVEDAIHSLFVRLWEKRDQLNAQVQVRPYLLISLRNDLLRDLKRDLLSDEPDKDFDAPVDHAESAWIAQEAGTEREQKLKQAMSQLSGRERELVELKFGQGLEYEQIVEITGISYQSARNVLARALGKLRNHLTFAFFLLQLGTNLLSLTLLYSLP